MPGGLIILEAGERWLTVLGFQQLASVPAAVEWFANIDNLRPSFPSPQTRALS